jgi:5'-3' exonuclease
MLLERFEIHPNNFAMARAMVGDKSDNIEGIPGVGLKTVAKRFPFLATHESVTFEKIISFCQEMLEKKNIKVYQNVVENEDLLRRNYQMMQLYTPMLSIDAKKEILETITMAEPLFNRTEVIKMMTQDGFGEINFSELFQHFNKICVDSKALGS